MKAAREEYMVEKLAKWITEDTYIEPGSDHAKVIAHKVSREDYIEDVRWWFQEEYYDGIKVGFEFGEGTDRLFRFSRKFIEKVFSLRFDLDDNYQLTVVSSEHVEPKYAKLAADIIDREDIKEVFEDHFRMRYKAAIEAEDRWRRCYNEQTTKQTFDAYYAFYEETLYIMKVFGLRVNLDDNGYLTIKERNGNEYYEDLLKCNEEDD